MIDFLNDISYWKISWLNNIINSFDWSYYYEYFVVDKIDWLVNYLLIWMLISVFIFIVRLVWFIDWIVYDVFCFFEYDKMYIVSVIG